MSNAARFTSKQDQLWLTPIRCKSLWIRSPTSPPLGWSCCNGSVCARSEICSFTSRAPTRISTTCGRSPRCRRTASRPYRARWWRSTDAALNDGRTVVSVVLSDDGKNCLEGVWFNQAFAAKRFRYGQRLSFSGKPKWYRDHWQMSSPRVQILDGDAGGEPGIVPIYPLTEDLRPEHLRTVLRKTLDLHASRLADVLPLSLRQKHDWPTCRSGAARRSLSACRCRRRCAAGGASSTRSF